MAPSPTVAGWTGVIAGIGLLVEGVLWTAGGWTPQTFADPEAALAFLAHGGATLRWAVLAGFTNLVFFIVFVAGLAARLRDASPTAGTATLWFGMLGGAVHLIVPFAHWYGVPALLEAAARDPRQAASAWTAFVIVGHQAAGGAGSLLMGLSMITAGAAVATTRVLPAVLGWVGIVAGAATVLTVFSPDTPLSAVAGAAFLPSLALAVVFRVWAGVALARGPRPAAASVSTASAAQS